MLRQQVTHGNVTIWRDHDKVSGDTPEYFAYRVFRATRPELALLGFSKYVVFPKGRRRALTPARDGSMGWVGPVHANQWKLSLHTDEPLEGLDRLFSIDAVSVPRQRGHLRLIVGGLNA